MNHNTFSGLRSLIALENSRWTKSYNWLKSSLVWLALFNGLMYMGLVYTPGLTGVAPDVASALIML